MSQNTAPPGDLDTLISQNAARLTEADTRLLRVLTDDPVRGAFANGKEVSTQAGVHPASAVRLARRLGFGGYPEFRAFLQASLLEGQGEFADPTARIAARLARAGDGGLLGSVIDSEIAALEALRARVCDADIRSFSQALLRARRIFVIGTSHCAALAQLIAMRLRRSGYDAVDLSAAGQQRAEWICSMGREDVLFSLSFRNSHPQFGDVYALASERGTTRLVIADINDDAFDPPPDHTIRMSRGAAGESQSLVAPMTVANTIILDLAAIDGGKTLRSLDNFRRVRKGLEAGKPD